MTIALYFALIFTIIGIFTGTCTMASDDSLLAFIFWQAPTLLIAIIGLLWAKNPKFNFLASIPAIPVLLFYTYWSIGLFINTNINGKSVCTHKMGYDFELVHSAREYLYAPYSIYVSLLVLLLIYSNARKVWSSNYNNWFLEYKKSHLVSYITISLATAIGLWALK